MGVRGAPTFLAKKKVGVAVNPERLVSTFRTIYVDVLGSFFFLLRCHLLRDPTNGAGKFWEAVRDALEPFLSRNDVQVVFVLDSGFKTQEETHAATSRQASRLRVESRYHRAVLCWQNAVERRRLDGR